MNAYRRLFTPVLRTSTTKIPQNIYKIQTNKLSTNAKPNKKTDTEIAQEIYQVGVAYSSIIFGAVGFIAGMDINFSKKSTERNTIGDSINVIGGSVLGVLCSPFYPLLIIIGPMKFLYDYNKYCKN